MFGGSEERALWAKTSFIYPEAVVGGDYRYTTSLWDLWTLHDALSNARRVSCRRVLGLKMCVGGAACVMCATRWKMMTRWSLRGWKEQRTQFHCTCHRKSAARSIDVQMSRKTRPGRTHIPILPGAHTCASSEHSTATNRHHTPRSAPQCPPACRPFPRPSPRPDAHCCRTGTLPAPSRDCGAGSCGTPR